MKPELEMPKNTEWQEQISKCQLLPKVVILSELPKLVTAMSLPNFITFSTDNYPVWWIVHFYEGDKSESV